MRKYIHIAIALMLVAMTFIKLINNYTLIFLQSINCVFLINELKKDNSKVLDNYIKFDKVNSYFFIVSIFLSIVACLIHLTSNELSIKTIEIIICIYFIYSLIFTIIVGLSIGKIKTNKEIIIKYLINAIMVAVLCYSVVSLKSESYVYLINKQIDDLKIYMVITLLGKFVIDIIVAFDLNFAI